MCRCGGASGVGTSRVLRVALKLEVRTTGRRHLTTPHKLQGRGESCNPIPGTVWSCVVVAKRRPRPDSFMRWLGGNSHGFQ